MAIHPSTPIGASIAALIDGGGDRATTATDGEVDSASPLHSGSPGPSPCLLLPGGFTTGKRIHLVGGSGTGKTSLAMDMAHSAAQVCPCRCLPREICHCLAVTLFVVDNSSNQTSGSSSEMEHFPIPCQFVSSSTTKSAISEDPPEKSRAAPPTTSNSEPQFQLTALGRIEIRRIQTTKELFQYLLTIQGKPVHDQPFGALVVDDLDRLTAGQPMVLMQTSEYKSSMYQTVE